MYELLTNMLKEEIRLHTTLYKSRYFYTFPILIAFFSMFITWGVLSPRSGINLEQPLSLFVILLFFTSGLINGAFGLHAKDYLERRFGEFGKLFSNTLILPISLRKTYLSLAIKDLIFYLFWMIIPVIVGYALTLTILNESLLTLPIYLLCMATAFLYGLLVTFFLSVLYEKNKMLSTIVLSSLGILIIYSIFHLFLIKFFPPYLLLINFGFYNLITNIIGIFVLMLFIYITIGEEYQTKITDSKKESSKLFNKNINPYFVKDIIDLKRTGGLFAKPFFSVFLPSLFLIIIFSTMSYFGEIEINLMLFAIIIGTLSSTLLNTLMTSDSIEYYRFLPVTLEEHVKNKIKLSLLIGFIQGIILLLIFAYSVGDYRNIVSSVLLFVGFLIYNLNLNFFLTGLKPYEYLLNGKVVIQYSIILLPFLVVAMVVSIVLYKKFLMSAILFLILVMLSKFFLKKGLKKWKSVV